MLTTVQDLGRWGYQARGVPVAGPMDPVSHRLANALVGNGRDAATLEVTLLGPELEFEDERLVAVTGAEFELSLDGRPAPLRRAVHGLGRIASAIRRAAAGRARLSRRVRRHRRAADARQPRDASGQRHGRGQRPRADRRRSSAARGRSRSSRAALPLPPQTRHRAADPHATLRVLPGPQLEYFQPDALDVLQSAPYVVGAGLRSHGVPPRRSAADARARPPTSSPTRRRSASCRCPPPGSRSC